MAKRKEKVNFVTELLSDMKLQLIRCRIALMISLAGNIIMAAVLVFR